MQTRAQSGQATATVALGAFVAAAAVAIGGRNRITVQAHAQNAGVTAGAPGYPPGITPSPPSPGPR